LLSRCREPVSQLAKGSALDRRQHEIGTADMEIADFFAVNVATLYRWKNDHPEFCDALKEAKTEADARVEASLYHRAIGYSYDSGLSRTRTSSWSFLNNLDVLVENLAIAPFLRLSVLA
jgi:hypothetical protein